MSDKNAGAKGKSEQKQQEQQVPIRRLTEAIVCKVTGESEIEKVTELEIIFTPTPDLSVLASTPHLRSLSLINTGLKSLPTFQNVSSSLQSLTLINQNIEVITPLHLPNLKQLFLQQNKISKIEGLAGLPRLQRLWLCGNKIRKVENIHMLGDLRELWLQDNRISSVEAITNLSTLRDIQLSANPITSFNEVQCLSRLPTLRNVGFAERSFAACPVSKLEGYRQFVLCALKTVRVVDGVAIDVSERKEAEDLYLERVLEFNDKIDAIRKDNERDLIDVEKRRRKLAAEADQLHDDLVREFGALEAIVTEGRDRIKDAQDHQLHIRQTNLSVLKSALSDYNARYEAYVDGLVLKEEEAMALEDQQFNHLEKMEICYRNEEVLLEDLELGTDTDMTTPNQKSDHPTAVCQVLQEGDGTTRTNSLSDELKNIKAVVRNAQVALRDRTSLNTNRSHRNSTVKNASARRDDAIEPLDQQPETQLQQQELCVVRAVKVVNGFLIRQHNAAVEQLRVSGKLRMGESESNGSIGDPNGANANDLLIAKRTGYWPQEYFIALPNDSTKIKQVLRTGFSATKGCVNNGYPTLGSRVLLATDPHLALQLAESVKQASETETIEQIERGRCGCVDFECEMHHVLTVRLAYTGDLVTGEVSCADVGKPKVISKICDTLSENPPQSIFLEVTDYGCTSNHSSEDPKSNSNKSSSMKRKSSNSVKLDPGSTGTPTSTPRQTTSDNSTGANAMVVACSPAAFVTTTYFLLRHQSGNIVFKSADESIAGMEDELSIENNCENSNRNRNEKETPTNNTKKGETSSRVQEDENGSLGRGCNSDDAQELLSWKFLKKADQEGLRILDKKVSVEVRKYYERISQELDPDTAQAAARADTRVGELKENLVALRAQIDHEKAAQEQILRNFRANGGGARAAAQNADNRTRR